MSHPATARLFIALDLPAELREELSSWTRRALRQAYAEGSRSHGVRALDPELLHLTVSFLGSRSVEQIDSLCAMVESCAPPPIEEISTGAPLWLPPRHPRALAVEVHDDSGGLAALHGVVAGDLDAAGLVSSTPHRVKHRAFKPHVTVARLGRSAAPRDRALEPTPRRAFRPIRLVLYRSWLSPKGASYEALAASDAVSAETGGTR